MENFIFCAVYSADWGDSYDRIKYLIWMIMISSVTISSDTHTYVYVSGGKKCSFFGEFGVLCFLETPVLGFAFLPYYRRYIMIDKFATK